MTEANRTVAVLKKNARGEEVRIDLTEFNAVPMVSCRTWFPDHDGLMHPSRNGINLRLRAPAGPDFGPAEGPTGSGSAGGGGRSFARARGCARGARRA